MRAFVTPLILNELVLSEELNYLHQALEQERSYNYRLEQKVKTLEERLTRVEGLVNNLSLYREEDLSRQSRIQFTLEKEIKTLTERVRALEIG